MYCIIRDYKNKCMYLYILDKQKSDHTDRLRKVAEKSKESDVNFVIHRGNLYKISKTFSNFGFLDLITNFMNDQANHYRANFMVYSEERDGFEFLYKNYFDEKLHRNKPRIAYNQIVFKTSPNEGLILYDNGEIYMGSLINGYRNTNGHGIYVYSNGIFEMGDFLDDELHCENGVTTIEGGVTLYGTFRGGVFIRGEKKDWKENVELKGKIESEALTGKGVKLFPNDIFF